MGRTATARYQRHESTQETVLRAADQLFYRRGLHEVSMDDIRDAAGVSLKAIYAAFPSKAALVTAYVQRRDSLWRDAVERYVTRRSSEPREQLLLVFDALDDYIRNPATSQGCAMQRAFSELSGSDSESLARIRDHKEHMRDLLVRTARRAGLRRPAEIGAQLMILTEGVLITAAISGNRNAALQAKRAATILVEEATRAPASD